MKNLKWLLIALPFLNVGGAMAQKKDSIRSFHYSERSYHHQDRMAHLYGIPNLTEDQKKKIKELKTPLHKEVLPLKNQLAEKKAHLKTLQTAEKADLKSINTTIDEMTSLQSQIMKKHAAHTQAVRAILTDDQRIAFDMREGSGMKSHHHQKMKEDYHNKRG